MEKNKYPKLNQIDIIDLEVKEIQTAVQITTTAPLISDYNLLKYKWKAVTNTPIRFL